MRIPFLAVSLAFVTLIPLVSAQRTRSVAESDRESTALYIADEDSVPVAAVAISHGRPEWREGYDAMLQTLPGANYMRLGVGWWTTFDSIGALEIGGTKIAAGSYYLGLAVDKDGAFSLLLFESGNAMKSGLLPAATPLYTGAAKPELRAPLTLAKDALKEVAVKLEIAITANADDPAHGRFSIRWGRHELSAPVGFLGVE